MSARKGLPPGSGTRAAKATDPTDNIAALRQACAEYQLAPEVEAGLLEQVRNLERFKGEKLVLTKAEQVASLVEVANKAHALRRAIEDLPYDLRASLDYAFFREGGPGFLQFADTQFDVAAFDVGGFIVPRIEAVARHACEQSAKLKGGRPQTVPRLAEHILCISRVLSPAGIECAGDGAFRDLCEAVFEAAGVSFSERAFAHFLRHTTLQHDRAPDADAGAAHSAMPRQNRDFAEAMAASNPSLTIGEPRVADADEPAAKFARAIAAKRGPKKRGPKA